MKKYKQTEQYKPKNKKEVRLVSSFLKLKNKKEAINYLRDLMTIGEIEEFANRLEIARLLKKGGSYKKIAEKTETSTATVTRVAHWLFRGCGGYWKLLKTNSR